MANYYRIRTFKIAFFLPSVLDIAFPAYVSRVMGVSRERGLGGQLTIKLILINHFKNYLLLPY
jgi:hypothetical protein